MPEAIAKTSEGASGKTYVCQFEVRGYELDSFGHVNNSVYLNYLEHARWQMLNEEGITLDAITRDKLWPVIASIEIRYLKPAFMGDPLIVRTRAIENGRTRFYFEQNIFKKTDSGEVPIASAKVQSVIINEQGRPVEAPVAYRRLWTKQP